MSIIQYTIPKSVAAAVELETIKARGRDAGVPDVRFGYSTVKVASNTVRITSSVTMALYFCNRVRELAARSDDSLLVPCAQAVRAAQIAIGDAQFSPPIEDLHRADI